MKYFLLLAFMVPFAAFAEMQKDDTKPVNPTETPKGDALVNPETPPTDGALPTNPNAEPADSATENAVNLSETGSDLWWRYGGYGYGWGYPSYVYRLYYPYYGGYYY